MRDFTLYFLLLLKLALAPALVALATAAGYRFGPRIAGWVSGFPIVAGPIILLFALEKGPEFAARAAQSSLMGLVSLCGFCVVYARLAKRYHWGVSVACGFAVFGAMTLGLQWLSYPLWLAALCAVSAIRLALWALPRSKSPLLPRVVRRFDVPIRMLATAAMVTGLTALASGLGPRVSGLLTPFPIVTSIMAVFAQREQAWQGATRTLEGLLLSLPAFVALFVVLARTLVAWGVAGAFAAGLGADVLLLVFALRWTR